MRLGASLVVVASLAAAGCGGCASAPPGAPDWSRADAGGSAGPLIVLDAGHGGHDPGASYFGLQEKHLALDIARILRAQLEGAGCRVVMTREGDTFVPLEERIASANRLSADLFISVHINANTNGGVSGAEVYYARESTVSEEAGWPPEAEGEEVGGPAGIVRHILWDFTLRRMRARSRYAAAELCETLRGGLGVSCKVKPARFVVLREAAVPAVLVEVGYLSHWAEAKQLEMVPYRESAARAIAGGAFKAVGFDVRARASAP